MHRGCRRLSPLPVLVAALGAGALLSGCSGQGSQDAAAGSSTTAPTATSPAATSTATAARDTVAASPSTTRSSGTRSAAASRTAAVDTDSVQTDPPVTAVDSAVVLTHADWSSATRVLEASAFAQGHLDADATCAITASRPGAATVTGTPTPATPGPSSTDCGPLTVAVPSTPGTWAVSVVYTVRGTRLVSAPTEVEVP